MNCRVKPGRQASRGSSVASVAAGQERLNRCARYMDGAPDSDTGNFASIDAAAYLARGQAQLPRRLINLVRVRLRRVFLHKCFSPGDNPLGDGFGQRVFAA